MFNRKVILGALLVLACVSIGSRTPALAEGAAGPEVGQPAPDFKLPYGTQELVKFNPADGMTLSQYKGKTVVLAFYPADWSSGCTAEVCTFRDSFADLEGLGTVILGISGDYVFSHREWAKHHNLKFPLLSDHDHAVAKSYGSYDPTFGYNKRTVYVVDGEGVVRFRNLDFKASNKADYETLRAEIDKLKKK